MDSATYRGLTFLLSLGTLPIACNPEKGDSETGDGTTGGATTGDPTTGTTTGDPTTEPTGGSGATMGPDGDICKNYVDWYIGCNPEQAAQEAQLLMNCTSQQTDFETIYGPQCAGLFDVLLACLSTSSCNDLNACEAETEAFYACSPPIGEVCQAYGAKYGECLMEDPMAISKYCQTTLNSASLMFGPMCGTAYEEYFACLAALSCTDLEMMNACEAQFAAVDTACVP